MRKLKVGVWILNDYKPELGGWYSYYTQIINGLNNYVFTDAEIIFIGFDLDEKIFPYSNKYSIKSAETQKKPDTFWRIVKKLKIPLYLKNTFWNENEYKASITQLKDELNKVVDIIYYPAPMCAIDNFPFIYTLWDLGHLSTYAFPEFTMNNEFDMRKQHHDSIPQKALKIFAESEAGKVEIVKYLKINEARIDVIPIFPSNIISDICKEKRPGLLTNENFFIHYPAQYWAHKNHYNLLIAFKNALNVYPHLKLVLTGADKGNKQYILQVIEQLTISENVIELGFVPVEELKWLYLNSQGLVMPTFLGPTNMPLLEAAELNCPVACSDLKGHREQLGEYGYYFEPLKSDSIYGAIIRMINDNQDNVIRNYESKFSIEIALKKVDAAFSELNSIRSCWGNFDKVIY